jgi:Cellulase (glycosyl hydrolase family 5)
MSTINKYVPIKTNNSLNNKPLLQDRSTGEIFTENYENVVVKTLDAFVNSWSGYNLSGLESGSFKTPGTIGINYVAKHDPKYVDWLVEQGVKTVRIPFMMERLCPVPFQSAYNNLEYAKIIQDWCKVAAVKNIQTFIDVHNYGKYTFQPNATMSSVDTVNPANFFNFFDDRYQVVSNQLEIRNPTNTALTYCYENLLVGQKNNQTPAKIDAVFQIKGSQGSQYDSARVYACYFDNKNFLAINCNPYNQTVEFTQRLNGVETILLTTPVPSLAQNSNITVAFYLGKLGDPTYNTWNATVNGVTVYNSPVATSTINAKFKEGQWGFGTQGTIMNVISYNYNIYGTTAVQGRDSAAEVAWGKTVGSRTYDVALHEWFYTQMFNLFDNMENFIGYMYNEPAQLAVKTTPSNYKTTATCTVFQQKALTKLRELGSNKWFGWTVDEYGGIQNVIAGVTNTPAYGPNFDIPFIDPLDKTFFDFHYYPDFYPNSIYSGSGTYGIIAGSGAYQPYTGTEIINAIEPVLQRVEAINATRLAINQAKVPLMLSETGIPESVTWFPSLFVILGLLRSYNCPFMYFGIGEFLGNNVLSIMADPNQYQYFNGVETLSLTIKQQRHNIVNSYTNA